MSNHCCESEDPICCQIGECSNSANGCPQTCIDGACREICTLNNAANDCTKICISGNCINVDPCCGDADPECCKSDVKCDPITTKTVFGNILCPTHCENGQCVLDDECCGRFDCCSSNFCAGIEIDGCPTICKNNVCVKERCCNNGNFDDCCDSVDPCCEINNSGGCPSINGCAQECKNGACVVSNPCCLEDSDLKECCEATDKKCCQLEKLGSGCAGKNTSQCTYNCVDGVCIPNDDCCNSTNPACCFINKNFGGCDKGLKKSTKYDPSIDCDIYVCVPDCPAIPPKECDKTCRTIKKIYENDCLVDIKCEDCDCPEAPPPITCPINCTVVPIDNGCVIGYYCDCDCPPPPPVDCAENTCDIIPVKVNGCIVGHTCEPCPPDDCPPPPPVDCAEDTCDIIPVKADGCVVGHTCEPCPPDDCPPPPPVDCAENTCDIIPVKVNGCIVGHRCEPCPRDCPPEPPPIPCSPPCITEPIKDRKCIIGWKCVDCNKCPPTPPVQCPPNSNICSHKPILDNDQCVVGFDCIPCDEDCPPAPPINCQNSCGSTPKTDSKGCITGHVCLPCDDPKCPDAPPVKCPANSCGWTPIPDETGCVVDYTCIPCKEDCDPAPPINCPNSCGSTPLTNDQGCVISHKCKPCENDDCPLVPMPICPPDSCDMLVEYDNKQCPIKYTCIPCNNDCDDAPPIDCPIDTCDIQPVLQNRCVVDHDCIPCQKPKDCPNIPTPVCAPNSSFKTLYDKDTGCPIEHTCISLDTDCEIVEQANCPENTCGTIPIITDDGCTAGFDCVPCECPNAIISCPENTCDIIAVKVNHCDTFVCEECKCPQTALPVCKPDQELVASLDSDSCPYYYCETISPSSLSGSQIISSPNYSDSYFVGESIEIQYVSDIPFIIPSSSTGTLGITQTSGLNTNSPTISGTVNAPDGSTVSVVVDGNRTITATVNNGNWSVTIPNLANGTSSLDITIEDPQGNVVDTLATDVTIIKPAVVQNDAYIAILTDDNTILKAYPDFNDPRTTKNPEPGYVNENVYNSVVFKYTIQPGDVSKEPFSILSSLQNSNLKFDTNDDKSFIDEAINTNVRLYLKNPNEYKINSGPTLKNATVDPDNKKYSTGEIFTLSIELDQPVNILTSEDQKNVKLNIEYGNDVYTSNFDMTLNSIVSTENSSILTFTYTITDKDYFDSNNNFVDGHYIRIKDIFGASLVANENISTDTLANLDISQYLPVNNLSFNSTSYISNPTEAITTDNNILVINDNNTVSIIDDESLSMIGLINNIDQTIEDAVFLDNGLIAVLTDDNTITILDSKNAFRIINTVNQISDTINSLDSSGDNLIINTDKDILSINTYELKPDIYTVKKLNPTSNIDISFVDKPNNVLYVINSVAKEVIAINIDDGSIIKAFKTNNNITDIIAKDDTIYVTTDQNQFISYNTAGEITDSIFIDRGNNSLTIAEDIILIGNDITNTIRKYDTSTNTITDAIGSGGIRLIKTLFVDNIIYTVNKDSNTIIKININTNEVENYCPPPFFATVLPPIPEIS